MEQQLDKIFKMAGKDWLYRKRNIKIIGAMAIDEKLVVKVMDFEEGELDINLEAEDTDSFTKECLPVDMTPTEIHKNRERNQATAVAIINNTHLDIVDLRQTVMETINKIKKDPAYIPQAKAINNNVNTIVNMTKLEFQIAKEMKKSTT